MTDFSLRRHTNYTINSEISGTLAGQEVLATEDGRVTLTKPKPEGLVISRFGGPKGTWYVPTLFQLQTIYGIYRGMKEKGFDDYTAFTSDYWGSTERTNSGWFVTFSTGYVTSNSKTSTYLIRCVRDLELSPSDITRQHVIANHPLANGYPVIDLSELSPMGCVLTSTEAEERRAKINEQTPSNKELLEVGIGVSGETGTWNTRMSPQFQVMRADLTPQALDWVTAHKLCKQYDKEGGLAGQWRLPTQQELVMIRILHPELLRKGGFVAFTTKFYWSFTEYSHSPATAWGTSFKDGSATYSLGKADTNNFFARCIRDLKVTH